MHDLVNNLVCLSCDFKMEDRKENFVIFCCAISEKGRKHCASS